MSRTTVSMSTIRTAAPARERHNRRRTAFTGALLVFGTVFALQACDDGPTEANRQSRINDGTGDFLASFVGPNNADLDVVRGEVTFDGQNFVFESTSAGPIGTTTGALFVWGVNRGAGTARFGALAPGVLFDAVVVIRPDGTGQVVDLTATPPAATPLPAGSISISGAELRAQVPASLLPSRGSQPAQYTVNFWPRVGTGDNSQISDFAPDNRNVPVRTTQ